MIEDIPDPDEKGVHCFVVLEDDLDVADGNAASITAYPSELRSEYSLVQQLGVECSRCRGMSLCVLTGFRRGERSPSWKRPKLTSAFPSCWPLGFGLFEEALLQRVADELGAALEA